MSAKIDVPALTFEAVSVRFGERTALQPASATLMPGEFVAVLGPNGAGKSTLLRALAGLQPHEGQVTIAGRDAATFARGERARAMSYLPQGHVAHWPLTVRDVVALGRFPHGVADPDRMGEADKRAVDDALERTDTARFAARRISELSGGERARVALARVLAVAAPIILADEPTAALDPRYQIDLMQRLKSEADHGALVLAVTHDLGLAARFADRVLMLKDGLLVADGPPSEAMTPARLEAVYGVEVLSTQHEGEPVLMPWRVAR